MATCHRPSGPDPADPAPRGGAPQDDLWLEWPSERVTWRAEIYLRDEAGNFEAQDFLEILHFEVRR